MGANPPYSSLAVANWFIENIKPVTPLKLQKLIYFAHGWYLALRDAPLIDERVEAWEFGPVVPNVYHEFKIFGNQPIPEPGTAWQMSEKRKIRITRPQIPEDAEDAKRLLARIIEVYGKFTAAQLSTMTHEPGSPWDIVRKDNPYRKGVDIPDDLIKAHFKGLAKK